MIFKHYVCNHAYKWFGAEIEVGIEKHGFNQGQQSFNQSLVVTVPLNPITHKGDKIGYQWA